MNMLYMVIVIISLLGLGGILTYDFYQTNSQSAINTENVTTENARWKLGSLPSSI